MDDEKSHVLTIDEMWENAANRFKELTNKPLRFEPAKTLEDCIHAVEKHQLPLATVGPVAASGPDKAKSVGMDILHGVKLLGGVAAQGASMVFPASSLCFNAISLLLDIPAHLHKFHKAVEGLFVAIWPSLSVFKIYKTIDQFKNVEPELNQAIHKLMISFVTICALSIKLRDSSRWDKFRTDMKLALLDKDSGVKGEIDRFKELTTAHTSIQATQTLKTVLESNKTVADILSISSRTGQRVNEIADNVASLKDADEKRKSAEASRTYLNNIRAKLGLDGSAMKASKDSCDKFWNDGLPDTASWLENADEHPEFQMWADRDKVDARPVFVLAGGSNTGKSVLISSVVRRLQSTYDSPTRQSARTSVASYFFPAIAEKNDQDIRPVQTALKCIAMQFAEADSGYAKRLSEKLDKEKDVEKSMRDATCQYLWEFLELGTPKGKAAYYLAMDGLESLPESCKESKDQLFEILKKLPSSPSMVRFIFSLRPEIIPGDLKFWRIDMKKHNQGDIRLYIDNDLKLHDVLQGRDEDSTRLRGNILDKLSIVVNGNYKKASTALEKIKVIVADDGSEAEVDSVLNESNLDEKSISEAAIKSLEETLKAGEISELNELLMWVIFGHCAFNIAELSAALFLRNKTRSILPLEKKLKGKYASIFEVSTSGYLMIANDMEDLLKRERTEPRSVDKAPRFSATITITEADTTKVQSFLWSFAQRMALDRFGFQLVTETNGIKGSIQVNKFDSHLTILKRTFALLAGGPNMATKALAPYLLSYLPQHLKSLSQALEESPGEKLTTGEEREIGDGLFSLFVSGDIVEKHWASCGDLIWYKDQEELDIFLSWLRKPTVTCHLGRLDREWLQEVGRDNNPYRAFLTKVMKMVARRWLQDREWAVLQPYKWLDGFLSMESQEEDDTSDAGDSEADGGTVQRKVVDWCKEVLEIEEADYVWEERLAETYHALNDNTRAIEIFRSAIDRGDSNPQCLEGLAKSLGADNQLGEACETMERALEMPMRQNSPNNPDLSNNYLLLSEWYSKLDRPGLVIENLNKALHLIPDNREGLYKLLVALLTTRNEGAVEMLRHLAEGTVSSDKPSKFGDIIDDVLDHSRADEIFGQLFSVVSTRPPLFERTLRELDAAIKRATAEGRRYDLSALLVYKGMAVYHYGDIKGTTEVETALDCWNACLKVGIEWRWMSRARTQASTFISAYHFEQARAALESKQDTHQFHADKLKAIAETEGGASGFPAMTYLNCYHILAGDSSSPRSLVRGMINSAFEMLSDDTDENDFQGFLRLGYALLQCGDMSNAFSAFSLLLDPPPTAADVLEAILNFSAEPMRHLSSELITAAGVDPAYSSLEEKIHFILEEVERCLSTPASDDDQARDGSDSTQAGYEQIRARVGQFIPIRSHTWRLFCDGHCRKVLGYEVLLNYCKYCWDTIFCEECLGMLKNNGQKLSMRWLTCNGHDLLRVRWGIDHYVEFLRGYVWVGGELGPDGGRVGGEFVPISDWLDGLKKEWDYHEKSETPLQGKGELVEGAELELAEKGELEVDWEEELERLERKEIQGEALRVHTRTSAARIKRRSSL